MEIESAVNPRAALQVWIGLVESGQMDLRRRTPLLAVPIGGADRDRAMDSRRLLVDNLPVRCGNRRAMKVERTRRLTWPKA
jgi:hypothetical protein